MAYSFGPSGSPTWTRREILAATAAGLLAGAGWLLLSRMVRPRLHASTFIAKAGRYEMDLADILLRGFRELGVGGDEITGKRILLKPNLVETRANAPHINTHPLVVRGAVEAFLRLGASRVWVAEGPGHRRDTLEVLEESGLGAVLLEDKIPFVDLNYMTGYSLTNAGGVSGLRTIVVPAILREIDWIVSVAKLKTHHWAGVTLSMKNLFGVLPGLYYGWPKNILHQAGIDGCIVDLTATLRPHFAIVDGIVGMEGDGPIMGEPRDAGVLVMGRNLPAVDATCARVMGIDPSRIESLNAANQWLGPIAASAIEQRGEPIAAVTTNFSLPEGIPAMSGIRL